MMGYHFKKKKLSLNDNLGDKVAPIYWVDSHYMHNLV